MNDALSIRSATLSDAEAYATNAHEVFGVPVSGERALLTNGAPLDKVLIGKVGERIVCQEFIHRLGVWLNGVCFPLGGLAGLATLPRYRRRGYATAMLNAALVSLREQATPFASLYPTTFGIYDRAGWTMADRGICHVGTPAWFAPRIIPKAHCAEAHLTRAADVPAMKKIRSVCAPVSHGFVERDDLGWRLRVIGDFYGQKSNQWTTLHCDESGIADGYAIFERRANGTCHVREMVAVSLAAFDGLLWFFSQESAERLSIFLPEDFPLATRVRNPLLIQAQIDPLSLAMCRVVDVKMALMHWPVISSDTKGSCRLQVTDGFAPWNDGCWLVETERQRTMCHKLASGSVPDATLDIQTLTQLCFSNRTITNSLRYGLLQLDHPAVKPFLESFFNTISLPFSAEHF